MKGINTLIKLHKRTLDELRRKMVSLESQKAQLQQAIRNLQQELNDEVSLGAKQPEMATFFGEFAKRIKERQEKMRDEIRLLDEQIKKLNEEIFDAFTELKKFEIAKENAQKRAAAEVARKEAVMLDEVAAQQYERKKEKQ